MTARTLNFEGNLKDRALRRSAFIPVRLQMFRWLPFWYTEAKLINISEDGFKIIGYRALKFDEGSRFWINVPLATWRNPVKSSLICLAECKWLSEDGLEMGGSLVDLSPQVQEIISSLLDDLQKRGRGVS